MKRMHYLTLTIIACLIAVALNAGCGGGGSSGVGNWLGSDDGGGAISPAVPLPSPSPTGGGDTPANPHLTSITPASDPENAESAVPFTLAGQNLESTGTVTFTNVENAALKYTCANCTAWSSNEIKGTVTMPGGKYTASVTVRGVTTTETVCFCKGKGVYTITVNMPNSEGRDKTGKVIPRGTRKLRITITGEVFTTPIIYTDDDGDISGVHTITDIPVGLNVATIQAYDGNDVLLAQRSHGFFKKAGTVFDAGEKDLGVAIKSDGTLDPRNIDIPEGTALLFENLGPAPRTVTIHCDGKTDKTLTLDGAKESSNPSTPATFPSAYFTFGYDDAGTWTYTSPSGSGAVQVGDRPTITALSKRASQEGEEITITGTGFRDQSSGSVTFGGVAASSITSWSDTEIVATVPAGAKSGPLVVTAHGLSSSNNTGFTIIKAIQGGTFTMGQAGVAEPTHAVTVSPFYLGRFEVTNSEYCAFLNGNGVGNIEEGGCTWWNADGDSSHNGIIDGGSGASPRYTVKDGFAGRPVVYVSWYGAVAYCNWASTKDGLTPCYGSAGDRGSPSAWRTRNGYRLTSEAEWEYACRAGSTDAYYWGSAVDGAYCWYSVNSGSTHHNAGGKTANAFDLYDMSGNVWEWADDFYTDYAAGAVTDPTGPESGTQHIDRGGGYDDSDSCKSAYRSANLPTFRDPDLGFRIARTILPGSMSAIKGGTFTMGQTGVAGLLHTVTISSFYMGNFEVTNTEYCAFLNDTVGNPEGNATEGGVTWWAAIEIEYNGIEDTVTGTPRYTAISGFENKPVVGVTWYGAVAYCNWASTRDGLTPCYGSKGDRGSQPVWRTRKGYRLATEAEWEYACRAGSQSYYYWGDAMDDAYCWYWRNSGGRLHDTGTRTANAFGLFDMSGNVWEWCNDWYDVYTADAITDPVGPETGYGLVARGGGCDYAAASCRSAFRVDYDPSARLYVLGFRLVRTR